MSLYLRILLFIGAVFLVFYVSGQVRKGKIEINHSLFWVLFSGFILLTSIFPDYVVFLARFFSIRSPSNIVFLIIIFILLVKLFSNSVEMSKLEGKIESIVQESALADLESQSEQVKEVVNSNIESEKKNDTED